MRIFKREKGKERTGRLALAVCGILTFAVIWGATLTSNLEGLSRPGPWFAAAVISFAFLVWSAILSGVLDTMNHQCRRTRSARPVTPQWPRREKHSPGLFRHTLEQAWAMMAAAAIMGLAVALP